MRLQAAAHVQLRLRRRARARRLRLQRAPAAARRGLRLAADRSRATPRPRCGGLPAVRRAAPGRQSAVRLRAVDEQHPLPDDDRRGNPDPAAFDASLASRGTRPTARCAPWSCSARTTSITAEEFDASKFDVAYGPDSAAAQASRRCCGAAARRPADARGARGAAGLGPPRGPGQPRAALALLTLDATSPAAPRRPPEVLFAPAGGRRLAEEALRPPRRAVGRGDAPAPRAVDLALRARPRRPARGVRERDRGRGAAPAATRTSSSWSGTATAACARAHPPLRVGHARRRARRTTPTRRRSSPEQR